MLGSNQRPLPCEGRAITSWLFTGVQKCLQNRPFVSGSIHVCSSLFMWVGVLIGVHTFCTRQFLYCLQSLLLMHVRVEASLCVACAQIGCYDVASGWTFNGKNRKTERHSVIVSVPDHHSEQFQRRRKHRLRKRGFRV